MGRAVALNVTMIAMIASNSIVNGKNTAAGMSAPHRS